MRLLIITIVAVVFAALVFIRLEVISNEPDEHKVESVSGLYRYVVEEDNVICYYNADLFTSSLSCVKMD